MRGDAFAIALLIEIGARFLAVRDVDDEPHFAGDDLYFTRRLAASEHTAVRRQAFFVPRPALRTIVNALRPAQLGQELDDSRTPRFRAGRRELAHEIRPIPVHDQPGQAVGFGEDEPARPLRLEQLEAPPRIDGASEAMAEELGIDVFVRREAPDARADLRRRRIGAPREKLPARRHYLDRRAGGGLAVDALDRAREHPGVTAPQRLLAPRLQL